MNCACIRGTFDFDLYYTSCKDIVYYDRSTWQEGVGYGSGYTLTITLPSGATQTHEVTVGVPLHLDFGQCVPAGVYKFSTNTCGEPFSKEFPVLCSLECGYIKATAKIGKGVERPLITSIRERIEYIKELVSFGSINEAILVVETTEKDIKRINCECSCS